VLWLWSLGHIAGIAAAVTGFISTIMAVPISIFIGRFIADRRCHYLWLFDMCNIISRITYLFKIDEKRVNITSKTEFDWVSRL
jgi:DHA1 family bicyclomycin/chloramphenicol resistance-like MFS transporter